MTDIENEILIFRIVASNNDFALFKCENLSRDELSRLFYIFEKLGLHSMAQMLIHKHFDEPDSDEGFLDSGLELKREELIENSPS